MRKVLNENKLFFRKAFLMTYDIMAVCMSGILALMLRFDFTIENVEKKYLEMMWEYLPYNILVAVFVFWIFRLYHSLWEFAGILELQNILTSCIVVSLTQFIATWLIGNRMPRSYYPLFCGVLFGFTLISRFFYRFLRIKKHKKRLEEDGKNTMIIGAGNAGNMIIKEIVSSSHLNLKARCIIDDDLGKVGNYIHGIRVVGGRNEIKAAAEALNIDMIIIAMPAISKIKVREIIEICKETNCILQILPGIYQFMTGEVSVSKLRKVEIEDLLGREPVTVDLESVMGYVKNKVVLVTGGGGSIGSELCRQIASNGAKQLIIVDIYENNAYEIQQELLRKYKKLDLVVLIASVRNTARMDSIFEKYHPQIVYHAAAHKHVPLMEDSPNEAIKNNVFGTWKTAMAADKYKAERFVMISTDKAVNPTNIMGASKRICEMIIQTYNNRSSTDFVAVRFGNVLGSNGSVIPLFRKQIEMGGPVTVTHPDIIRYFMTIPEAVSLVLQAGAYAKGGEIFVLDMGEPVKILDLANNLIRLSGYIPGEDIMINFSGLRPGEKLYEELLMEEEGMQNTANQLIHIGKPIEMDETLFMEQLEELRKIIEKEPNEIRKMIQRIVPTYQPAKIKKEIKNGTK